MSSSLPMASRSTSEQKFALIQSGKTSRFPDPVFVTWLDAMWEPSLEFGINRAWKRMLDGTTV